MNVVGSSTRLLFCEGEPQSLDRRLLGRLLVNKPPTRGLVPAGGKQGLNSFVAGYRAGNSNPPEYVVFRDRDFDAAPPAEVQLIQPWRDKPIYLSHRAAVENYLLEATLIDEYWSIHAQTPKWAHGESPGVEGIREWIHQAANELPAYQACRWALASIKPAERWPEVKTTWTSGSGHLPPALTPEACQSAAEQLVAEYQSQCELVSVALFRERYADFHSRFAVADFIASDGFVMWFHGKDLLKSMQRVRLNTISLKHFCEWAAAHVNWSAHPDLVQLEQLL